MKWIWFSFLILFNFNQLQAALLETSFEANYRTSKINEYNFQESLSFTVGVSYYFQKNSAFELSYTKGESIISIKPTDQDERIQYLSEFDLFSADFVVYFGSESSFQPYFKAGIAHIEKQITKKTGDSSSDFDATTVKNKPSLVPSLGLGLKFFVTDSISLRFGINAWSSDLSEEPITWDYAGKAGISFYL
jgi:outer membrane protein W